MSGEVLVKAGVPNPWAASGPQPVRNQAAQQEVGSGRANQASSAAPHCSHYCLNHPSNPSGLWKNCLPRSRSLVPKRLGTAELRTLGRTFGGGELRADVDQELPMQEPKGRVFLEEEIGRVQVPGKELSLSV